jgi:hypothetical protein
MTPQRDTHWVIIRRIVRALEDRFGMKVKVFSTSASTFISQGTAENDYDLKRFAYAEAEVPPYVIADPYQGQCHVHTDPERGDYDEPTTFDFGTDIDLTGTVVDLVLKTDEFPRD